MQAALISLVLMSGACGDMPPQREEVTISMPGESFHGACGCQCPNPNPLAPPLYRCCPEHSPAQPACTPDDYWPACYFYPRHRLLFHPAHYTQPYAYRNEFNYPWDDLRVPCAIPPIGY